MFLLHPSYFSYVREYQSSSHPRKSSREFHWRVCVIVTENWIKKKTFTTDSMTIFWSINVMITYEIHCIVKYVDVMITILEIAHFFTCIVAKIVVIFPRFYDLNYGFEFLIVFTVVHVDEFTNVLQRSWLTRNMWSEDPEEVGSFSLTSSYDPWINFRWSDYSYCNTFDFSTSNNAIVSLRTVYFTSRSITW